MVVQRWVSYNKAHCEERPVFIMLASQLFNLEQKTNHRVIHRPL